MMLNNIKYLHHMSFTCTIFTDENIDSWRELEMGFTKRGEVFERKLLMVGHDFPILPEHGKESPAALQIESFT